MRPKRSDRKLPAEVLCIPPFFRTLQFTTLHGYLQALQGLQTSIIFWAQAVASKPYDVLDSSEAKDEAEENPHSFLRVIKPEIELSEETDPYSEEVYEKGRENFLKLCKEGVFKQDSTPSYYLYRLTMNGRSQTGLVGCCEYQEYYDGRIKKHELTRTVKENDRVRHVECLNANAEPVFFSYRGVSCINEFVDRALKGIPVFDFLAEDGVRHELWTISGDDDVAFLEKAFLSVPDLYVADGHHRTAAAARVGQKRKDSNSDHRGNEEYNFFMAVLFPDDQLEIFDYNRVVKDLNGLSPSDFLSALSSDFEIRPARQSCPRPSGLRQFSLYLDGAWHELTAKTPSLSSGSPIGDLDAPFCRKKSLDPYWGLPTCEMTTGLTLLEEFGVLKSSSVGWIRVRWLRPSHFSPFPWISC